MPPSEPHAPSLLEDAIDIPLWLERDRATPFSERMARDRSIGLASPDTEPVGQVREWWRRIASEAPGIGRRLVRVRALVTLVVALLGVVAGAGLALGALRYEGVHPVNVVTALALLVVLPLALLALSLLLLPERLPGLAGLQRALAAVNVGSAASALAARFVPVRADGQSPLSFSPARRGPAARVGKWQVMLWSQVAGVGFGTGALVASILLVVFTDLAFGWSTTLDLTAAGTKALVDAVAVPWSGWWAAAVPDEALIAESRFYRLEGDPLAGVTAERLTGWWPFLLAALVVYGLLPRALMLAVAGWRLRSAERELLLSEPEVRALLDRLRTPEVATGGVDAAAVGPPATAPEQGAVSSATPGPASPAGRWQVLVWNDSLRSEHRPVWLSAHLGRCSPALDVGGGRSLAEDLEAIGRLPSGRGTNVAVLTKAWEPPLGDCRDLLAHLRTHLGPEPTIMVVPIGVDGRKAGEDDIAMWRRGVTPLGDPALYVELLGS